MKKYMVITATGLDRPGIVDQITEVLLEYGANVEESRMARLGGEFAVIMLASVSGEKASGLQQGLAQLGHKSLTIATKMTDVAPGRFKGYIPYELFVSGADHEGIIHSVAHFLSEQGINVETLESDVVNAPVSGTALFSMHAMIQVPPTTSLSDLREKLAEIGDSVGVDIEVKVPLR